MKKVLLILAVVAAGIVAQSCGGAEKCPAYTEVDMPQEAKC